MKKKLASLKIFLDLEIRFGQQLKALKDNKNVDFVSIRRHLDKNPGYVGTARRFVRIFAGQR